MNKYLELSYAINDYYDDGGIVLDVLINNEKMLTVTGKLDDEFVTHDQYFMINNAKQNIQIYDEGDDMLLFWKDKKTNVVMTGKYREAKKEGEKSGWVLSDKVKLY